MLAPHHLANATAVAAQVSKEADAAGETYTVPDGVTWLVLSSTDNPFFLALGATVVANATYLPAKQPFDLAVTPGTILTLYTTTGTADVRILGLK